MDTEWKHGFVPGVGDAYVISVAGVRGVVYERTISRNAWTTINMWFADITWPKGFRRCGYRVEYAPLKPLVSSSRGGFDNAAQARNWVEQEIEPACYHYLRGIYAELCGLLMTDICELAPCFKVLVPWYDMNIVTREAQIEHLYLRVVSLPEGAFRASVIDSEALHEQGATWVTDQAAYFWAELTAYRILRKTTEERIAMLKHRLDTLDWSAWDEVEI